MSRIRKEDWDEFVFKNYGRNKMNEYWENKNKNVNKYIMSKKVKIK